MFLDARGSCARIRDLLKERLLAVIEKYGVYTDKVEKDQGTSYRV